MEAKYRNLGNKISNIHTHSRNSKECRRVRPVCHTCLNNTPDEDVGGGGERENVLNASVCLCVFVRKGERNSVCVCERERERERVCMCVL